MKIIKRFSLILTFSAMFILILTACSDENNTNQTEAESNSETEWEPDKPVEIVIPFSSGGGSDSRARILAEVMEEHLPGNQPINVVNKPGGGGVPAYTETYNADADGYTLIYADTTPMIVNSLISDVDYNPENFETIGTVNDYNYALYTNPETLSDVDDWNDLMEEDWKNLNVGTVGVGSGPHLAGYFIGEETEEYNPDDTSFVHYDSTSDAMAGFQRGDVDLMFGAHESNVENVEEGITNDLVIFSDEKSEISPELPTSQELDIPNASEANDITQTTGALYAPPETPDEVKNALSDAMEKALNDSELQEKAKESSQYFTWHSAEDTKKRTKEIYDTLSEKQDDLNKLQE